MSTDTPPSFVVPVMRLGYAARGITYAITGSLALTAALWRGNAEGTTGALATLRAAPWGTALLWVIALGLICYCLWRLICAAYDLEDEGTDAKGLVARAGQTVTGLLHAGIGLSVAGLALGGGSGGGSGAQDWTQRLMALPYGKAVVIAAGLVTICAGIYYAHKGLSEKYKSALRLTPTTRRLNPVMKFGFVAQGGVIGIIGALIVLAGWTADASEAGGVGAALDQLRGVAYGRILLGVTALGLIAFAVENFVEAAYRIVPRCADPEIKTLATRAKDKAREAAA